VTVHTLDTIASALGARIDVRLSWNGEALDRLLDAAHADLVEQIARRLDRAGWETLPEVSFNEHGERGSIDLLCRHRPTGCILVVEVKSVVPDVQATIATLDRKARLAQIVARDRHWPSTSVARLLVIGENRTARRRVDAFETTFRRAFPLRGTDVDGWLRSPDPAAPMSGLRFLSRAHQAGTRHRVRGPRPPLDPDSA
jgi:Holliday junction resolvase-like predicted endonuclease